MEGTDQRHWFLVVIDLLGHLMMLSGFSALFCSNTEPGQLLIMYGYAVELAVDFCRLLDYHAGTSYPSAATKRLDFVANMILCFGSVLSAIANFHFMLSDGNKSLVWLGVTGSFIMFTGSLLHAVKVYKMQQLNVSEDGKGSLYQSNNQPSDASIVINCSEDTKGSLNQSSNQPLDDSIVLNVAEDTNGNQNQSSNQPLYGSMVILIVKV